MIPSSGGKPLALNDEELARLDELLAGANEEESMTLEEFDGFTAATLSSPTPIGADELLGEILGAAPETATAGMPPDDRDSLLRLLRRRKIDQRDRELIGLESLRLEPLQRGLHRSIHERLQLPRPRAHRPEA
jgi:hypothetical protein